MISRLILYLIIEIKIIIIQIAQITAEYLPKLIREILKNMVRLVLLGINSKIKFTIKIEITILFGRDLHSVILLINLFIWKFKSY